MSLAELPVLPQKSQWLTPRNSRAQGAGWQGSSGTCATKQQGNRHEKSLVGSTRVFVCDNTNTRVNFQSVQILLYPNSQEMLYKEACVGSCASEWGFLTGCKHTDLWLPLGISPTPWICLQCVRGTHIALAFLPHPQTEICKCKWSVGKKRSILKICFKGLQLSSFQELLKILFSVAQLVPNVLLKSNIQTD